MTSDSSIWWGRCTAIRSDENSSKYPQLPSPGCRSVNMRTWIVVGMLITGFALGCSSPSNGGTSCPMTPCGGNPLGTWQIDDVCTDWHKDPVSTASCPGASSTRDDLHVSGTVTFRPDDTYS